MCAFFDQMKKMLMDEPDRPSQAEVASEFGMTENAVKQAFYRFRQRYQTYCERRSPTRLRCPAILKMSCAI